MSIYTRISKVIALLTFFTGIILLIYGITNDDDPNFIRPGVLLIITSGIVGFIFIFGENQRSYTTCFRRKKPVQGLEPRLVQVTVA